MQIVYMLAVSNDLNLLPGDFRNIYFNVKPRKKCFVTISDELFGPTEVGKKAKNVQALYLMKSSGVAWQDMISTSLKYEMKFNICGANNDIWYKPSTH